MADRFGDRWSIAIGLGGAAPLLAAAALAQDFATLSALLVGAGMLSACTSVTGARLITGWFGQRELALAMSIRQMSVILGGASAALLLPWLTSAFGVPAMFVALAVISAMATAICVAGAVSSGTAGPVASRGASGPTRILDRDFIVLASGNWLVVLVQNSVLAYFVLFLTTGRGYSLQRSALIFLGVQLTGALGRVVLGRLSDRILSRLGVTRWTEVAIGVLLIAVAAVVRAPDGVLLPVLCVAAVLSMSPLGLPLVAAAEFVGRERAGMAIGVMIAIGFIAGLVAPSLFGAVVTAAGWAAAFVVIGVAALGSFFVLRPLARRERRPVKVEQPESHPQ